MGPTSFFQGGIVPRDDKERILGQAIRNAALPSTAIVPFKQHNGAEALPLVAAGDVVREHGCIAEAAGKTGARVHSPIPGTVREIREISLADGTRTKAAVIDLSGSFERTGRSVPEHAWEQASPADLIKLIRENGVVGMTRSAVPTNVKLDLPQDRVIQLLIVNGMESEPFQTADARLMVERPGAVFEGTRIVQHIVKAAKAVIAISDSHRLVEDALKGAQSAAAARIKVQAVPALYPQGDERLLMQSLLGVDVPQGSDTSEAGAIVMNVATVCAVYDAVVHRRALTERVVTVAGDAVSSPMNLKVRIGTSIASVLEECGGLKIMPDRIIVGGPMLGHAVNDLDLPITKQTAMILALTKERILYAPERPCIRCGICVRSCPAGLEPMRLFKLIGQERFDDAVAEGLMECSECGICSYACPSRVRLVETLRDAKAVVRARKSATAAEAPGR